MRKILVLSVLAALLHSHLNAQQLVSSSLNGTRTQAQLIAQFQVPFLQYGAKYYKITYTSKDAKGQPDTLSGLIVVPDNATKVYPRLVYQHGTSSCKTCVPSRLGTPGGDEGDVGLIFAAMGYVSLLPDYVGMGDGRGFQTYVHAATAASAALDMLRASEQWLAQNGYLANEQLFITGYSQGGHAAMALHREIELNPASDFEVTAAAHLSGPYSISGVMRDLILSQDAYFYPAYIPNTLLGYQEVYGNLYTNLSQLIRPEYLGKIQEYHQGSITLTDLNAFLIQTLTTQTGSSVARRMFTNAAISAIIQNPEHPINIALRENDVYNWKPERPTRIFYCTADDQVPYLNSLVARDTMLALGAANFQVSDVGPNLDHGGCVTPALTQTLLFFAGFQSITSGTGSPDALENIQFAPNPASNFVRVSEIPAGAGLRVLDWRGREVYRQMDLPQGQLEIPVNELPKGVYFLHFSLPGAKQCTRTLVRG